jgi:hypothetical protein
MQRYLVQTVCSQCGQKHHLWVALDTERQERTDTNVDDAFRGRVLPPELSDLLNRRFQCPNTARFYSVETAQQLFLKAA